MNAVDLRVIAIDRWVNSRSTPGRDFDPPLILTSAGSLWPSEKRSRDIAHPPVAGSWRSIDRSIASSSHSSRTPGSRASDRRGSLRFTQSIRGFSFLSLASPAEKRPNAHLTNVSRGRPNHRTIRKRHIFPLNGLRRTIPALATNTRWWLVVN